MKLRDGRKIIPDDSDNGSDVSTLEMRVTMIMVIVKMVVILVLMSMSFGDAFGFLFCRPWGPFAAWACDILQPKMFVGTSARENQKEMDSLQLQSLRSFYCFFWSFWMFLDVFGSPEKWFEMRVLQCPIPIETSFTMNWHRGHGAGARAAMLKGVILSCPGKKQIKKTTQKKSTKKMFCAFFCAFWRTLGVEGALVPQTWLDLNRS